MHAQQLTLQFDAQPSPPATYSRVQTVSTTMSTVPAAPWVAPPEQARRELAQYLHIELGVHVELAITDNRRHLFAYRRDPNKLHVRLHHMFLRADANLRARLAKYLGGDRSLREDLLRFMRENLHQVRRQRRPAPERLQGAHYDLRRIYDALNHLYFEGKCDARITWGKLPPRSRRRRHTMRLGSYTLGEAVIRIHPLLDDPRVPEFFVASVVHHEMLHHMVPAREVNGRTLYHSPEFRRREREFALHDAAQRWEKEHITELLRR